MWIKNTDMASVYNGYEADLMKYKDFESIDLIQIFGILRTLDFPKPFKDIGVIKKSYQFEFEDVDETDENFIERGIQPEQAIAIHNALMDAYNGNRNVIVHCFAGVSRSGAVVDYAQLLGFEPLPEYRARNEMVYSMLRKCNGRIN